MTTCNCSAYGKSFPHRLNSGKCKGLAECDCKSERDPFGTGDSDQVETECEHPDNCPREFKITEKPARIV